MNPGIAQRLREGTQTLHTQAERAGIMPPLLKGQLPKAGLALLQRNLHPIYQVLEPLLQRLAPAHPALAAWADPRLARCSSLADDLCALHGPDWPVSLPLVPAATAYAERLQGLADAEPTLLAAHAYVRYLGDLAGGQALGRVVRRSHALAGNDGSRFFDFGPPDQVAVLVQSCRRALNDLPLTLADALLAEARWGFHQHVLLFEQLSEQLADLGPAPTAASPAQQISL